MAAELAGEERMRDRTGEDRNWLLWNSKNSCFRNSLSSTSNLQWFSQALGGYNGTLSDNSAQAGAMKMNFLRDQVTEHEVC